MRLRVTSLFALLVLFAAALPASAQDTLRTATWSVQAGEVDYLQTDNAVRGGALNASTGSVLVVSRTGGLKVVVLDAATGGLLTTLNVEGISGGTFPLNEIAVTDDGQIFAANLAIGAPTKVYRWADESAAPEVVFEGTLEGPRYGDAIGVGGTGNDVTLYLSGSGNDRIAKFAWNGSAFDAPTYLIPQAGTARARLGIATIPGEDALWINGAGTAAAKIDATSGAILREIDGSILSAGHGDITYFERDGRNYIASGPEANTAQHFNIVDVTDATPVVRMVTERIGANANANGSGFVAYDDVRGWLIVGATNNAVAAYDLAQPTGPVTIAEARAADNGTVVTIEGTVTRTRGAFTYLQDGTAGITVRQTSGAFADDVTNGTIAPGTVVRITGKTSEFRALKQINGADLESYEVVSQGNALPEPTVVTLAELKANGEQYEGKLVSVENVTINTTDPTFSAATTYQITDPTLDDGTVSLRVPNAADSELDGEAVPTGPVTFTGVISQFDTGAGNAGYQLLAVNATDVAPFDDTDTIAEARAADNGTVVTIEGTVTRSAGAFTYLQDGTAGIAVRQTSGAFADSVADGTIRAGTVVRITGKTSEFRALKQINGADLQEFTIVGQGDAPEAQAVTLAELKANGEQYEAELVTVSDVEITTTSDAFSPATTYPITDPTLADGSVTLRVPNAADSGLDGRRIPRGPVLVTSVVGQFDTGAGNAGYQLLTVNASDVTPMPVAVADAAWSVEAGTAPWLTTGNTARGGAYNPATDHILVVSREGGLQIVAIDPADGSQVGTLNVSGISGGTFPMSEIAVTADGQIYGANLAIGAPSKIYRWASEDAAPVLVFEGTLEGPRYGDVIGAGGTGDDTVVYLSGSGGNDRIARFEWNGTALTGPTYLVPEAGNDRARYGIAPTGDGTVWINEPGSPIALIDGTTGQILREIDGTVVNTGFGDIAYFENNGHAYIATGPLVGANTFVVLDVTNEAQAEVVTTTLPVGANANANATGFVAYDSQRNNLVLMATNNVLLSLELGPVGVSTEPVAELPAAFVLHGNYPNPFNPSTTISFDLQEPATVRVEVYDVVGRQVADLPAQQLSAGTQQSMRFDGSALASGVYVYRVIAEMSSRTVMQTGRMVLVK